MAPDRHKAVHGFAHRAVGRVHIRVYRARLDVVDGDAARAEVARQAAHDALYGRFRHAVGGAAAESASAAFARLLSPL